MKKVLVIGEILVEIMADSTEQSFLDLGKFTGPFASGAPAIFIDQVAKFKVPATIVSAVGDDDFGKLCIKRLQADGVDTQYIKVVKDPSTGIAFIRYNSDGSRNFIFHINNAACGTVTRKNLEQINWDEIAVFHIMGSSIFNAEMYELHKEVLEKISDDCLITFDPNVRPEILSKDPALKGFIDKLLKKAQILFVTEDELEFLTSKSSVDQAMKFCFLQGVVAVIVKRGPKGASLFTQEKRSDASVIDIPALDPTGAGDTFAGAFIAGYIMGWSLEKCLEIANLAGTSAVLMRGPMEGTLKLEDIDKFASQLKSRA